jgi:hypothetical protein
MTPDVTFVARIVGLASARAPSGFDGKYLKEYDPSRPGVEPDTGRPVIAHVVVTDDPRDAMHFASFAEFQALYKSVDPDNPVRPDGQPNRPLTAFTFEITKADHGA